MPAKKDCRCQTAKRSKREGGGKRAAYIE